MKKYRFLISAALLLCIACQGRAEGGIELSVEIGYAGIITYNREMPFIVTVKNAGPEDVSGRVEIDFNASDYYYNTHEYPAFAAAGAETRIAAGLAITQKQASYTVRLVSDQGEVLASTEAAPGQVCDYSSIFVGALTDDASALSYMNINSKVAPGLKYEPWQVIPLTPETFPDDAGLMEAFQVIVVDSVDMRDLSPARLAAFESWLNAGGVVIVGGGAGAKSAYPYFEKYTGASFAGVGSATGVVPALRAFAGRYSESSDALDMVVNAVSGDATPLAFGDTPLLFKSQAGAGAVVTCAFPLGDKAFSNERGLMRDILSKAAGQEYWAASEALNARNENGSYYSDYSGILTTIKIPNSASAAPILIILLAYALLAGFLSYFILKKLDKRELMWLTTPLLALAGALLLRSAGASLDLDKPLAASYIDISYANGEETARVYASVASPSDEPVTIASTDGYEIIPTDYSNYDGWYYDSSVYSIARELQYTYLHSKKPSVTWGAGSPWTKRGLVVDDYFFALGDVSGRAWMDEEGLVIEITNSTQHVINGGAAYSRLGFVRFERILPGETVRATLVKSDAEIDSENISEGMLLGNSVESYYVADKMIALLRENKMEALASVVQQDAYSWNDGEGFEIRFVGMIDDIRGAGFSVDGANVERCATLASVRLKAAFEPIGETGIVYYPPRSLYAGRVIYEEEPIVDNTGIIEAAGPGYYPLAEAPLFALQLPQAELGEFEITVSVDGYYDTLPQASVYNFASGEWENSDFTDIKIASGDVKNYLDSNNMLFVLYAIPEDEVSENGYYGEVSAPYAVIEGRIG